jgi:hypothetical protein
MQIINKNTLAANIFDDLFNNDVLLFYYGQLDFDITNQIIKNLSERLKAQNISRKVYNSIYATCAEGIENAYKHQKSLNSSKIGLILISKNKNSFYISIGNPIDVSRRIDMDKSLNDLKMKSEEELRGLIKEKIAKSDINNDESAGIGLIKIILNSKHQATAIFKQLDKNELLFIMQIKIDL